MTLPRPLVGWGGGHPLSVPFPSTLTSSRPSSETQTLETHAVQNMGFQRSTSPALVVKALAKVRRDPLIQMNIRARFSRDVNLNGR